MQAELAVLAPPEVVVEAGGEVQDVAPGGGEKRAERGGGELVASPIRLERAFRRKQHDDPPFTPLGGKRLERACDGGGDRQGVRCMSVGREVDPTRLAAHPVDHLR